MAADLRRQLENDRALDDRPEPNVTVTELRTMVVGGVS
jgi:hypothetical protein